MMFYGVFTPLNYNDSYINIIHMLICGIILHILISVIDHNFELKTSLQQLSHFSNVHKHFVDLIVDSIWKCKYIERDQLIFSISLSLLI